MIPDKNCQMAVISSLDMALDRRAFLCSISHVLSRRKRKMRKIIPLILMTLLFSACQSNTSASLVGRWEWTLGGPKSGLAYEFYEDGTFWRFQSNDPISGTGSFGTYKFDPTNGELEIPIRSGPDGPMLGKVYVTFNSKNKMTIDRRDGITKPMPFIRKSLPELPPKLRSTIGTLIKGKSYTLVEAKKLVQGWDAAYRTGYTWVVLRDYDVIVGKQYESWLVTIQIESEDDPKLYYIFETVGLN
jgi:hypothetical protein